MAGSWNSRYSGIEDIIWHINLSHNSALRVAATWIGPEYRKSCSARHSRLESGFHTAAEAAAGKYVFSCNKVSTASTMDPTSDLAQIPQIPTDLAATAN